MDALMRAENIAYSYANAPFMEIEELEIYEGEFMSVVGENGSGKSTLLGILNGKLKSEHGSIFYRGKRFDKIKPNIRAKEIAVIYQNQEYKFPFKCFEIVEMGLYPHKSRFSSIISNDIEFILDIMERTDTLKFADKNITELSGGEVQRVLIARALAQKPRLLFLDEAMSGLDIASRIKMTKLLKEYVRDTGMSVVSVQHDLQLAFSYSDKITAMKGGKARKYGRPKELLNERFFKDIFNVKAKISHGGFYILDII